MAFYGYLNSCPSFSQLILTPNDYGLNLRDDFRNLSLQFRQPFLVSQTVFSDVIWINDTESISYVFLLSLTKQTNPICNTQNLLLNQNESLNGDSSINAFFWNLSTEFILSPFITPWLWYSSYASLHILTHSPPSAWITVVLLPGLVSYTL